MNTTPKGIFFDWDGTLVDTLPFLFNTHNHVRRQMGFDPWSIGEFKGHVLNSTRDLYGKLYGEQVEEATALLRAHMEANHLDNLEPLPDSVGLLEALKDNDITVGIISNKRHEFLLKEVAHLGWDYLSDVTIGAGFCERDKPAADPLLHAFGHCGLEAGEDIWYVGDSETDMLAAQAAGCAAILVRHNHDNEHLEEKFGPFAVFDDCAAMQKFLFGERGVMSKKLENS